MEAKRKDLIRAVKNRQIATSKEMIKIKGLVIFVQDGLIDLLPQIEALADLRDGLFLIDLM
ncbi:MAG: hypothetical protein ACK5P6_09715 [Pseudobdellovibrionaceae bacterium]